MGNEQICSCGGSGQPVSHSLTLLCDMLQRADERRRKAVITAEIKGFLSRQPIDADEWQALAGILAVLKA
jgi:hypothetical protein